MSEASSRTLLERLVGFATVSRDSNLELIAFIRDYLAGFGVHSELFHNDEGTKANLFATIGPLDRGGVVLSGHTDVVPVDGQAWSVEPFRLSERDGRLYGRGTADMKGFIASVLAAVPAFLAQPLKMPVHLAFSYDEEVGCLGVRSMLGGRGAAPAQAAAVPDWRAHRAQAGARPQGQAGHALRGARCRLPFGLCPLWGQRHRVRGAVDRQTGRDR
ncbi:acetylornithine deacetylase/succinyl-diaminopimelate desuccinylase-like protein [Pseudomonas hunanensis]|nr:acetylornithine deacetylase/succinyl-diaminopimelate desuccinylase-like protein [Pseudomonas hunanensis]